MAEDVTFFKEHGADDVLSKPVEINDLLRIMDQLQTQRTLSSDSNEEEEEEKEEPNDTPSAY